MKNFYQILALLITPLLGFSQVQEATLTLNPEKFNEDESVTLTFGGIDASVWGTTDLYLWAWYCLLYTSPSPRDATLSRMPSSA